MKKTTCRKIATAGILVVLAVLLMVYERYADKDPSLILPYHIAGVGNQTEVIVQDGKGCSVRVLSEDGNEVFSQQLQKAADTLTLPSDESGEYTIQLYTRSGKILDEEAYTVTDSAVYTEEYTYQLGASTVIRVEAENLSEEAWIGVYEQGIVPGETESVLWERIGEGLPGNGIYYAMQMHGSTNLFLKYTGSYTVYLFPDKGYDPIASWDFSTCEENVLAARWEPDSHCTEPGDSQGFICLLGRPESENGEKVWVCWGKDNKPLEGYDPIFSLNASAHYMVSGEIPAHSVFPEGAAQILICADQNGKPGKVLTWTTIQPELRHIETEEPNLTFSVISDTHVTSRLLSKNNYKFYRALSQITEMSPLVDLIINNGDVTDNGAQKEYKTLERLESLFDLPDIYYTIGNHDSDKNASDFSPLGERFLQLTGTGKVYYSFARDDCTFIALGNEGADDTGDPDFARISQQQLDWLEETLQQAVKENPHQPVFVFVHQPLQGTVAASFDSSDLLQSQEVMEIVERYPQVVLFSGHTHRSMAGTLALRSEEGMVTYVHDGVVCAVWDGEKDTKDSQGLFVSVYDEYILISGRSFENDAWIGLCNWKIALD